MTCFKY